MKDKYEIAGKSFVLTLTLRQDESLGAINHEMLEECPELMDASSGIMKAKTETNTSKEAKQKVLVKVAFNMVKAHAWIYKKRYASRILAILLVPQDEELKKQTVEERQEFMADNATRELANEVINFFFTRSGAFGINIPPSSTDKV
jgi:predicted house-cleaning noncanonical NTP pyrophosphatase (MazG superfamily)